MFNATGTTHLVAISGLHVTLFALLAFFVARLAVAMAAWLLPWARFVEREPFAVMLGLAAAGAYSLLAGFSVPAQRTWLMLACVALARLAARHAGAGRTWTLALIAVLLLDPFAPLSAGFWLSFVAVGVILAATSAGSSKQRADGGARVERRAPAVRHHAGAGATHVRGVRWVVDRGARGSISSPFPWSRSCSCRWCWPARWRCWWRRA